MRSALNGLAERVLGQAAAAVTFERLADGAPRELEYEASGGELAIRASDAPTAAVALHDYLRRACGRQICWDTALPLHMERLPSAPRTRRRARVDMGYYLNFCTFGYTAAYWDWPRWEREIDWMALHGITMPLAVTGHEAVLYDVYTDLGMDDADVRAFLGGPGYLPWQFMGCLDGFPSPLPAGWIEARAELGARIVARERELGMTPVLPTFTGHVPRALAGKGTTERDWMGFTTHFLGVGDPRFVELSGRVMRAQQQRLGTAHLYASDPFIEMTPPSGEPAYLAALAQTILAGLRAVDELAVWVMQTWPFSYHARYWSDERVAALLDAVPDDALLLLDLWAERAPQWRRFGGFRGKPWVWCALHDFGGRCDLFGNLPTLHGELEAALACPDPPSGVGLAMEATETNHLLYELAAEQAWEPVAELDRWSVTFAARRYGEALPEAARAWTLLLDSVYAAAPEQLEPLAFTGALTSDPRYGELLDPAAARTWVELAHFYGAEQVLAAWRGLLDAAERRPALAGAELGHDLAVVAATAMTRVVDELYVAAVDAYAQGGEHLGAAGERLLDAFLELDLLLDSRPELRLRTWEDAARACAGDEAERPLLLEGARRIVSVWARPGHDVLGDYSARLWSGLVGGYYRERWRCWLDGLTAALEDGRTPDDDALTEALLAQAGRFVEHGSTIVEHPTTTTAQAARRLYDRYAELLLGNPLGMRSERNTALGDGQGLPPERLAALEAHRWDRG